MHINKTNIANRYDHDCNVENAEKFWNWMTTRGGIAVWESVNLSNPGATWSTPATIRKGDCEKLNGDNIIETGDEIIPYPKPTWQAASTPTIITDLARIEVYQAVEVKRFHVGVRRGDQGLMLKVTDGGSRRIRAEVAKAGEGSFYAFAYDDEKNCIIYRTETLGSLAAYAAGKGWVK